MITRRAIHAVAAMLVLVLGFARATPVLAQPRPGEDDVRLRQERYNQAILALQDEHNKQVANVEQAYNAHRIDRRELDGDLAALQRQYDGGVAEQRRMLER